MGMPAAGWQILREDLATDLYAEEQTRRFVSALIRLKARHQRNLYAFSPVKTEGGSTTIILDTAACLQQLGSSVLVVEANSYAPSALFDDLRPGLTDYLAGKADAIELPKPYTHNNVLVSVVGIGNERVRGLQQLDRLHEALKTWSEQYEYVLVDLPPLLMSADAEMLIEAIGQVFLVVEAQAVNRGEISRSKRLLQKIDPEAVGLFVNKVPLFRGSGYMEGLIIETLSRSKLSTLHEPGQMEAAMGDVAHRAIDTKKRKIAQQETLVLPRQDARELAAPRKSCRMEAALETVACDAGGKKSRQLPPKQETSIDGQDHRLVKRSRRPCRKAATNTATASPASPTGGSMGRSQPVAVGTG